MRGLHDSAHLDGLSEQKLCALGHGEAKVDM